jgi:PncC family amidohydrolase
MEHRAVLDSIADSLIKTGETVAVAESVTSGDIQSMLSSAKDAMNFFQGGITAYNIRQKVKHLQVDPVQAMASNCVSQVTAEEMAHNVRKQFASDWGIAITGYASLVPEMGIEELFAFTAVYYRDTKMLATSLRAEQADPAEVRKFYTREVLSLFADLLRQ